MGSFEYRLSLWIVKSGPTWNAWPSLPRRVLHGAGNLQGTNYVCTNL